MATNQEMDAASAKMHHAAKALYGACMDTSANQDADIQAAFINGLIAAASDLLWDGRADDATPERIAGNVHAASLDIIRQMQARQQPH